MCRVRGDILYFWGALTRGLLRGKSYFVECSRNTRRGECWGCNYGGGERFLPQLNLWLQKSTESRVFDLSRGGDRSSSWERDTHSVGFTFYEAARCAKPCTKETTFSPAVFHSIVTGGMLSGERRRARFNYFYFLPRAFELNNLWIEQRKRATETMHSLGFFCKCSNRRPRVTFSACFLHLALSSGDLQITSSSGIERRRAVQSRCVNWIFKSWRAPENAISIVNACATLDWI